MAKKNIRFVLVQIDEAHSSAWPIGLKDTVTPQRNFIERVERANNFMAIDKPQKPFEVLIDTWDNEFANLFQAWPDKYYLIDKDYKILSKSDYGMQKDALINEDCCVLLTKLLD